MTIRRYTQLNGHLKVFSAQLGFESMLAQLAARMSNEPKIEARMIEVDDEACIAEADAEKKECSSTQMALTLD